MKPRREPFADILSQNFLSGGNRRVCCDGALSPIAITLARQQAKFVAIAVRRASEDDGLMSMQGMIPAQFGLAGLSVSR